MVNIFMMNLVGRLAVFTICGINVHEVALPHSQTQLFQRNTTWQGSIKYAKTKDLLPHWNYQLRGINQVTTAFSNQVSCGM